eukprot:392495-Prorocentrum_minimum.AAC.1
MSSWGLGPRGHAVVFPRQSTVPLKAPYRMSWSTATKCAGRNMVASARWSTHSASPPVYSATTASSLMRSRSGRRSITDKKSRPYDAIEYLLMMWSSSICGEKAQSRYSDVTVKVQ